MIVEQPDISPHTLGTRISSVAMPPTLSSQSVSRLIVPIAWAIAKSRLRVW